MRLTTDGKHLQRHHWFGWTCLQWCIEMLKTQPFTTFEKRTKQRLFFEISCLAMVFSWIKPASLLRTKLPMSKTWSHKFHLKGSISLNLPSTHCTHWTVSCRSASVCGNNSRVTSHSHSHQGWVTGIKSYIMAHAVRHTWLKLMMSNTTALQ